VDGLALRDTVTANEISRSATGGRLLRLRAAACADNGHARHALVAPSTGPGRQQALPAQPGDRDARGDRGSRGKRLGGLHDPYWIRRASARKQSYVSLRGADAETGLGGGRRGDPARHCEPQSSSRGCAGRQAAAMFGDLRLGRAQRRCAGGRHGVRCGCRLTPVLDLLLSRI
jgi:hypothetical protein